MDIIIGYLAIIFAVPLLTGFCAISYNRSFWLWFLLAMVLPFVSWFILIYLIYKEEKAAKSSAKEQVVA